MKKDVNILCRICDSNKIESFNFNHEVFPGKKNKYCKNFFCLNCKSISHYYTKNIDLYQNYRIGGSYELILKKKKLINSPIALPWSEITFKRSKKIYSNGSSGVELDYSRSFICPLP